MSQRTRLTFPMIRYATCANRRSATTIRAFPAPAIS